MTTQELVRRFHYYSAFAQRYPVAEPVTADERAFVDGERAFIQARQAHVVRDRETGILCIAWGRDDGKIDMMSAKPPQ